MNSTHAKLLLKGIPASPGLAEGHALVIKDAKDQRKTQGYILVAPFATPLLIPAILNSKGIVTDKGGLLCHAAVVAREFGIPCVTGTEDATSKIEDNMELIVDGTKGYVYKR
ncbi:MAG: PEP-utilizing enzyme [Chloroflexota bacterium]